MHFLRTHELEQCRFFGKYSVQFLLKDQGNTKRYFLLEFVQNICRTCVRVISLMCQMDKKAPSKILDPVLPNYMSAFVAALSEPENAGHYKLKKDIIKTITILTRYCQIKVAPYLPHVLPPAWAILTSITVPYSEVLVGNADDDEDVDSDGEKCGIESTLYAIFELVQALLEVPHISEALIASGLTDLIYYTIFYMQLPQVSAK